MKEETRGVAAEKLVLQMVETMHAFRLAAERKLKAYNIELSPEQFKTLMALHHHKGISMSELADRSCRDKTTVTRMIDGLEKLNLVLRVTSETDRRQIKLYLTAAGKTQVKEVRRMQPDLRDVVAGTATIKELRATRKTLEAIMRALRDS